MVPDTGLDLTDMAAAHHQHRKTALTDTAANGQGQLIVQKHLVERKLSAVIAAGFFQLSIQGLSIHADTHGGNFQSPFQDLIPEENITV